MKNIFSSFAPDQKQALRQTLLARRNQMPPAAREELALALCQKIAALPCFRAASMVLLYYPVGSELSFLPLAAIADANGIPVGFPICGPERTLVFRQATAGTQPEPGAFGIPVPPKSAPLLLPDEKSFCLLPALGYDQNRFRIGYGGGYYDRFLSAFPGVSVGACPEEFLLESVFPEPHDKAADLLITEKRIFSDKNSPKIPDF